MAETAAKKKENEEARCLSLRQKLNEMRKACPEILKQKHSDAVSYTFAKIYDVWEKITPVANELGVDFEIIKEAATKHAENGDPVFWITMTTKTFKGERLMFLYEADLTIRWTNLDDDDDFIEVTVHALGWNDDPAKAKGSAHTYALKYYLFEKFCIDQGEADPDGNDFSAEGKTSGGGQSKNGAGRLSDAQVGRLYKKAEAAGMSRDAVNKRIAERFKKSDPALLSREEYDEICGALDKAANAPKQ